MRRPIFDPQQRGGIKKLEGGSFKLRQRQNMKGNDSTDQGKTKHT